MQSQDPIVFITGNSRSGTTLMMRLLNNHKQVHAINEPHFFETMWSNSDKGKIITSFQARELLNKLIVRQREGFFEDPKKYSNKYVSEIEEILQAKVDWTKEEVYRTFVFHETRINKKNIPCEKTPQNVFYIEEILRLFPSCTIINMIRDPRDVLLSQKMKWKRPQLGAGFMTDKEVKRLKINYHPITISKLWNAAISAYKKHSKDPRVIGVKFEYLINDTKAVLLGICDHLNIDFEDNMLNVPFAGSSTKADSIEVGIRQNEKSNWIEKGLEGSEINICQKICKQEMTDLGYNQIEVNRSFLSEIGYYLSFPFKVMWALLANLNRMRSIRESLTKRLNSL